MSVLKNDTENLQDNIVSIVFGTKIILLVVVRVGVLMSQSWQLAIACMLAVPGYRYIVVRKGPQIRSASEALQTQEEELDAIMLENLQAVPIRKQLGLHPEFDHLCKTAAVATGARTKALRKVNAENQRLLLFLTEGSSMLVLFVGGFCFAPAQIHANVVPWPSMN
eukprot:7376376-Prymnesium_polylepis.1